MFTELVTFVLNEQPVTSRFSTFFWKCQNILEENQSVSSIMTLAGVSALFSYYRHGRFCEVVFVSSDQCNSVLL